MLLAHAGMDTHDADLRGRVLRFIEREIPYLDSLIVDVDRGVVRLSGEVNSFYQRQRCLHACRRVAGVVRIDDDLSVR